MTTTDVPTTTTRRSALGRIGLALAGLAGVGAGSAATARLTRNDVSAGQGLGERLTVHAPGLRTAPGAREARAAHLGSDPFGELVDERQRPVGSFRAHTVGAGSLHTFTLEGGLLLGLGAGGLEGTTHAIVGGTGRFAGAAGSYTIEDAPALPGRALTFTFTMHRQTLEV